MNINLLDRKNLNYSKYFFDKLELSNAKKEKDSPVAVVLQAAAETDPHRILGQLSDQALILQIAQTHRVAMKSIHAGSHFQKKIQEVAQQSGRKPEFLMISAHGTFDSMTFGKKSRWDVLLEKFGKRSRGIFHAADIQKQNFSDLAPNAQIFLVACNSGFSLAQKIADISKRIVFAPREPLSTLLTCLERENHKFKILSFNTFSKSQQIYEFAAWNVPKLVSGTLESIKKDSFSMRIDYARELASRGDAEAQADMGFLYVNGLGELAQSDTDALRWLRLAADQGNAIAQSTIGSFYEFGRGDLVQSDNEALNWYRLAANQGDFTAQWKMGHFCELGLGGLAKSDEEALKWFRLAANQGHPIAEYKIGEFYEKGRAQLTKSDEDALSYYLPAAYKGIARAQHKVGLFYECGRGGAPRSHQKALKWLHLAADQELPAARDLIEFFSEIDAERKKFEENVKTN